MTTAATATATLIPLEAVDPAMIEAVLDRAFGDDRHARTAYRIRAGMDWLPGLSLAALDEDDMLVGTIQCWPIALATKQGQVPLVMVGPVAVVPERQGEGFGVGLISAMLAEDARLAAAGGSSSSAAVGQTRASSSSAAVGQTRASSSSAVVGQTSASSSSAAVGHASLPQVLIGDAAYYGRWGFSAAMTGGWRCPGPYDPSRLLARGTALAAMPAEGMLGPWEQ